MFIKNQALIVVDMQNDFCEGGTLAIKEANAIIPELNSFIKQAVDNNVLVIFTKDMHPNNHKSLESNGGIWPDHCVVNTSGANLHHDLYIPNIFLCVHKGTDENIDGYSAFEKTGLEILLRQFNIFNLLITGVAIDYCVFHTSVDAKKLGFNTSVVKGLTKAVDSSESNLSRIWQNFEDLGIKLI